MAFPTPVLFQLHFEGYSVNLNFIHSISFIYFLKTCVNTAQVN